MRSALRARRKVLQRSKKREEAGRGLRPLRSASHGPDASSGRSSLAAHAGGRKAVSDPQGCGSGGRGSALPTCGLLGDPGLRAVGLRGRPRPRRWPRSLPRMLGHRWRGKAASGAPTPPLVSSVEPEDRSLGSRPSCAVWLRDPAAGLGVGGDRVSPPGPPAHSRVSLPPIPLHERPEGRGVSATGGGAGYNQSQAGNSSRGALAGLREWGGGAAGAEAGNLPARPRPLLLRVRPPHHGNWAAGRPPGSAPHSCLWGRAGHEGLAAPFGPVRGGRRGFPNPPPHLRPAPPPHSR